MSFVTMKIRVSCSLSNIWLYSMLSSVNWDVAKKVKKGRLSSPAVRVIAICKSTFDITWLGLRQDRCGNILSHSSRIDRGRGSPCSGRDRFSVWCCVFQGAVGHSALQGGESLPRGRGHHFHSIFCHLFFFFHQHEQKIWATKDNTYMN